MTWKDHPRSAPDQSHNNEMMPSTNMTVVALARGDNPARTSRLHHAFCRSAPGCSALMLCQSHNPKNNEPKTRSTNTMKTILNRLSHLAALTLAGLVVGCAGSLLNKENAAVAADFKAITPSNPAQQAFLKQLTPDKMTRIIHDGKPYYILPDVKNNQAYVGGPRQFQTYQQIRETQKLNSENLEATPGADQLSAIKAMDWSGWSGWGAANLMDRPGWY